MDGKDLIKEAEKWVKDVHKNAPHLIRTGYWVKKLDPSASDGAIIAGIIHDIERAFPENRKTPTQEGRNFPDKEYNLWHGKRSAEFAERFLNDRDASEELISEVKRLVIHHEDGGRDDENLVKDADSVSFLENQVPYFIKNIPKKWSKEGVRQKFEYMFNRITSPKAKELARPMYEKALERLEKVH